MIKEWILLSGKKLFVGFTFIKPPAWSPYIEELVCQQEEGNKSDSFAVAVLNPALNIVGHVPQKMSAECSGFLESGGTIRCTITEAVLERLKAGRH